MKEIKKYIIGDNGRMHNVETGEWFDDENVELVKYSDVEQLQARIKELESDVHINEIKAQGIEETIKKANDKEYLYPIKAYVLARRYIAELKRYVETIKG